MESRTIFSRRLRRGTAGPSTTIEGVRPARGEPASSIKAPSEARSPAQTMMNTWTHLFAAGGLALMALIIHVSIRNNDNIRLLDTARYYTMVRERGDVSGAKSLVSSEDAWLSLACRLNVSKALPTSDACIDERRVLRNKILAAMNCLTYSSQVCSYLRTITAGIIQNKTIAGTTYAVGRTLLGTVPNLGTLTYRQLLYNAIENAPYLFHNAYRAAQYDDSYVLRTILYNTVVFAILANILVHILDTWEMSWGQRLFMRVLTFSLSTIVLMFLFLINNAGSSLTALLGIWAPSVVVLLYYEAFLDQSVTRPWIHPFTFSVMYASISVLALTENDVLNSMVVGISLAQAHAVSMLYMQIVWYWTGKNEKKSHEQPGKQGYDHNGDPTFEGTTTHAAQLYTTKEMQYALYLAIVATGLLSIFQAVGPFDYNTDDFAMRAAPCLFLAISIFGTLYMQDMQLDDEYGIEKRHGPKDGATGKERLVYYATRITGGKLGVSLLLLAFGAMYELNIVGDYFRSLRAYVDKLPDRAWQYDAANKYTIGTGFLPSPAIFL